MVAVGRWKKFQDRLRRHLTEEQISDNYMLLWRFYREGESPRKAAGWILGREVKEKS